LVKVKYRGRQYPSITRLCKAYGLTDVKYIVQVSRAIRSGRDLTPIFIQAISEVNQVNENRCPVCGNRIEKRSNEANWKFDKRIYCGNACSYIGAKGKPMPRASREMSFEQIKEECMSNPANQVVASSWR